MNIIEQRVKELEQEFQSFIQQRVLDVFKENPSNHINFNYFEIKGFEDRFYAYCKENNIKVKLFSYGFHIYIAI